MILAALTIKDAIAIAIASPTVVLAVIAVVRTVIVNRNDAEKRRTEAEANAAVATANTDAVEEREETERMRIRERARAREDRVIAEQLTMCHEERKRISDERNILVQNVTALVEENTQLRVERIGVEERIEKAEKDLRDVRNELRGCHDQHSQTAQQLAETVAWVRENFVPRGPVSEAPRPRNITPVEGTPAVHKEQS